MSDAGAREEIQSVVQKHAGSLDPGDLREIAHDLEVIADRWEDTEGVLS